MPELSTFELREISANGIRQHVAIAGRGQPLVLLHGWPEFWGTWRKLMAILQTDFTLIAPDLRGFGDSEKPYDGPSDENGAEVMAADLQALVEALKIERFGLVSHDVGSYIAQVYARAWPEHLAGLFFFNCVYPGIGARWAEPDHLGEIWYQAFHQQDWAAELVGNSRDTCRLYIKHFLRHWSLEPDAFDADLETWVDNFMKPGNLQGGFNWYRSVHRARIAAMKGETAAPPVIELPTRFLWGRHDPVLKLDWSDGLEDYFGDMSLEIAAQAGHFVHYEQPDLAAAHIRDFFTSKDFSPATEEPESPPTESRSAQSS